MRARGSLLLLSFAVMGSAALLGTTGDNKTAFPDYQPVADWPSLPASIKLGPVTGVATDAADRTYIFHRGKNPVVVLDKDGKYLRSWGDGLVKIAHAVRLDRNDHVWLTDLGSHLVMKFTPEGKLLLTLGQKDRPGEGQDQFNKPADVAFGPAGEIFVADGYGNARVMKFAKDGSFLKTWGKKGKAAGEFNLPHAICTDAKGRVFVGDRENNRVQVFDQDGKFLAQWPETGAPFGLFLTGDGRMLLADGRAHRTRVLDLNGKTLGQWGQKGVAAGQFTLPHWVCMDSRGAVYVAEVDGKRVQKFVGR